MPCAKRRLNDFATLFLAKQAATELVSQASPSSREGAGLRDYDRIGSKLSKPSLKRTRKTQMSYFADLLTTSMLAASYLQHNLARLIKYNAHAVAVVCDATKLNS